MNRIIITILLLLLFMFFLTRLEPGESLQHLPESMMALGFALIVSYLFGKMLTRFKLPKITGYIIAGIAVGPYLLNMLSVPVVRNLQLIDSIALSLIALTAGGEFRYKKIRSQFRVIGSAILGQIIIVMTGFLIFITLYRNHITFLNNVSWQITVGVALLFGALSIATSPATTIAIITESKARGPFTDFVLAVTVLKDIVVVLLFSIVLSLAEPLILHTENIQLAYFLSVFFEIILSIIFGVIAGFLILLYLKYIGEQKVLFLLGFILLWIELSHMIHLEVILLFMVAGFFVQNFSDSGSELIESIEEGSLPIFVIFFTIAGASLNFPIFLQNYLLAILIVSLRLVTTYLGTFVGGRLTAASWEITQYGWMGFVGQAGLTLGLAVITRNNLPGPIGLGISTLIISSIAINQIIGPVLFRYAVVKVGEAHRKI
jgi:Kef-type K+ transport system membrane component KefB